MNRRVFVLGLGAASLAGCASLPDRAAQRPAPDPGMLEPIYAVAAGPEGVTVRVASGGCTGRDSFAVYVDRSGRTPLVLLGRRRLDRCKSLDRRGSICCSPGPNWGCRPDRRSSC